MNRQVGLIRGWCAWIVLCLSNYAPGNYGVKLLRLAFRLEKIELWGNGEIVWGCAKSSNVPAQARRAKGVRFETEVPNRRCLQPAGWAMTGPGRKDTTRMLRLHDARDKP